MINVATDCSGIETPLMALDELGIIYHHVFSSDIDSQCKRFIKNNFPPEMFFDDIETRDNSTIPKDIDLYIAGFPCQSFSSAGRREGLESKKGQIIYSVSKFIHECKPKVFLLENVKGLVTHNKGETFKTILSILEDKDYTISYKVLNTMDYGIPQSRNRVFIVGIRNDVMKGEFKFPEPIPLTKTVRDIIDSTPSHLIFGTSGSVIKRAMQFSDKIDFDDEYIISCDSMKWAKIGTKKGICPCITRNARLFITRLGRRISPYECLALQGVDYNKYNFKGFSNTSIYGFAGNCMSVPVLKALLNNIFRYTNIRDE